MPLARGEHVPLLAFAESWYPRFHYGWSELRAVRDGRYKFIQAPRPELYALDADPGESHDLAASDRERADAMARALGELATRVASQAAPKGPRSIDAEAEERLEALGYVAGSASARNLEDRPRGDPKDKIGLYNLLKQAGGDSVANRLEEAIAKVQQALAQDPEIVEAHTLLGNFYNKQKRYEEAAAAYRRALALDPEHQGATFSLALAQKELGRTQDAEVGFERARALDPRATKPLWQLADIWMQRGQYDRAESALKEALARKVDRPALLLKLAECYIEMKRYGEAEVALGEVQAKRPDLASVHYDLALVYEARGDLERATHEYEAELTKDPTSYRASFNLAKLLLAARRHEQAVARFREAVASNPAFGTGYLYLAKALLDQGQLAEAEEMARRGLREKPEPKTAPLGHYVLADVYSRRGRLRESENEVAAARKLERPGG
jgi:tetratricopeptide (TPR) repeat protein